MEGFEMKKGLVTAGIVLGLLLLGTAAAETKVVGSTADGQFIYQHDAPNGQAIYFVADTDSPEVAEEDVNFDGVDDLVVITARGMSNYFYEFFVRDGDSYTMANHIGCNYGLINYILYPEEGWVESRGSSGLAGLLHERCLFRWEGTDLRLVRRAVSEHPEVWEYEDGLMTQRIYDNEAQLIVYAYGDGEYIGEGEVIWERTVPVEDVPDDFFEQEEEMFYAH